MIQQQPHQPPPHQPYAPQPPHPYAQPYAHPHPYAHPYAQQYPHPHPQQPPSPPAVPEEVGDVRRMLFATVDGAITLFGGCGLALQLADKTADDYWIYAVACVFGVSFVHHVLGAVIFRTTVGKFLLATRVVREADAGRPRFWQAVGRWLLGLTWLPMQPIWGWLGSDGDPYEDGCGLRYVYSKDLRNRTH